jgi:diaminopimelate epimerase
MNLRFTKMHGAGNDFVVVDCRSAPLALDARQIAQFGDRHVGVGFDQLLTIEPARDRSCAFAYGIFNSDGSPSGQCGNGVRCIAAWLRRDGALGVGAVRLQSPSGPVSVEILDDGRVRVDMGTPHFAPQDIPLLLPDADPYRIELGSGRAEFGAVSMGNPHAVIEVADVDAAPLATLGRTLSHDQHFPQGCNVGFVQIDDRAHVRLRVWERGAGATLASSTPASPSTCRAVRCR